MERQHSRSCRTRAVKEPKGNRAGHLVPHLPGAAEGLDAIEEALQVLRLGLVPCGNTLHLSHGALTHSRGRDKR